MKSIHKIILSTLLALAIVIVVGYYVESGGSSNPQSNQLSNGQLASDPNFFAGNVTTKGIPPGTYNGTGVYDHNCFPTGNGWYSCDAGINTRYGTIDFAYHHDMMVKPCIGPGDKLVVTVLNSSGAATVNRTAGNSSYI